MSERCLEGVWKVSKTCLEGAWKVSGRCLEGPDWTGLALFGSGRYLVMSECCLDIMDVVWKEHLRCLESTYKMSGSCSGPQKQAVAELEQKKGFSGQKFWKNWEKN